MWSMFHVVKKHTSTTNNSLEAFNGNFNQCQPGHQTIYSALEGFKREVEFTEIKHSELTSGKFSEPQAKRKNLKLSSFIILFWEALYILKSRQCLPFYFGEHCKFMRSCLHSPFYFGEHCIFWKVVNAYHFILGRTVNLYEVVFIYHFILGSTVYFEKSSMLTILFCGAL